LAIESKGTGPWLPSKLIRLQDKPAFRLLATGGTEHWGDVCKGYAHKLTLGEACGEIVRLLEACMGPKNQAFGLLCGYNDGQPACYRINRSIGASCTTSILEPLTPGCIQPIGCLHHKAIILAQRAIRQGHSISQALRDAIETLIELEIRDAHLARREVLLHNPVISDMIGPDD